MIFVTEELAKQLKEKEFNQPCFAYYEFSVGEINMPIQTCRLIYNSESEYPVLSLHNKNYPNRCSAPTYDQVFNWLEQHHQIFVDIVTDQTSYPKFAFEIAIFEGNPKDLTEKEWGWKKHVGEQWFLYRTRKHAKDAAIKEALTLIKIKQ